MSACSAVSQIVKQAQALSSTNTNSRRKGRSVSYSTAKGANAIKRE